MSQEKLTGWALLHAPLPDAALKPLSSAVYGIDGLTDVNEGYLIERLHASGLEWGWTVDDVLFLGNERRQSQRGGEYTVYMAGARGALHIAGRTFAGAGASDNKKLDAAFKGAATVAFKNACKLAGLTTELYKGGKALDIQYDIEGTTVTGHQTAAATEKPKDAEKPKPEAAPVTKEQQKTLVYLLTELPSYQKDETDKKPEEERAWSKKRVAEGIKAGEARQVGLGFLVAFNGLLKQHHTECGTACPHETLARASDGMTQYNKANPDKAA